MPPPGTVLDLSRGWRSQGARLAIAAFHAGACYAPAMRRRAVALTLPLLLACSSADNRERPDLPPGWEQAEPLSLSQTDCSGSATAPHVESFRVAVDQVRQPFFCNAAAQAAALEALNHQDEVTRRVERNLAERMGLEDGLRELGIQPAASQANFVWFDLGEDRVEADVMRGLAERGILVRAGSSLGREGALRVTVGTQAENERFLEALAALL